jgi:hypothetical protein
MIVVKCAAVLLRRKRRRRRKRVSIWLRQYDRKEQKEEKKGAEKSVCLY